ncbi:Protein of unknown function [Bacillus thuringiensis]|uniref:Uncharacterized protein n=1 Tax=Bacillus thuringiensis TaxID=1428 RepID=A0A1C4DGQ6_BACTU|nr:Protein of unknown function [Bacillus thuringiensis]
MILSNYTLTFEISHAVICLHEERKIAVQATDPFVGENLILIVKPLFGQGIK